ncbi:MAG: 50S ribosomal protein L24 [Chloroflexota bacterium]
MAVRSPAPKAPKVPEIRKGDTVVVLAGKDAGKRGTVERVVRRAPAPSAARSVFRRSSPKGGTFVVVEGLNVAKRHTKPRQSAGTNDRVPKMQQGGILDIPQPLPVSRVMLVCTNCGKPTRIAHATLETGRRVRVCRHCSQQLEVKS